MHRMYIILQLYCKFHYSLFKYLFSLSACKFLLGCMSVSISVSLAISLLLSITFGLLTFHSHFWSALLRSVVIHLHVRDWPFEHLSIEYLDFYSALQRTNKNDLLHQSRLNYNYLSLLKCMSPTHPCWALQIVTTFHKNPHSNHNNVYHDTSYWGREEPTYTMMYTS